MRLDDFDPNSVDVEDQRGQAPMDGGGGFSGLPLGGGHIGLGGIIVILILSAVFHVNPLALLGGMQSGPAPQVAPAGNATGGHDAASSCTVDAASHEACNALASLNKTWTAMFAGAGKSFARPHLVFYSQEGSSGCGAAQSAMGPFYCPEDRGIYLDTDFYRQMDEQLGASGQFARDYVIAHEYGHHIQNLLGTAARVTRLQHDQPDNANHYSVMLELQADCYAGVWAAKNADRMEPGDMESGMNAAHQIGDDTLMKSAGRTPVEAAFTHGTSAQRMQWLKAGMDSGDPKACNTFGSSDG